MSSQRSPHLPLALQWKINGNPLRAGTRWEKNGCCIYCRSRVEPDHRIVIPIPTRRKQCKRSMNPTFERWGSMAILEFAACSSTAAGPQRLLRSRLVASAQVHGAATHLSACRQLLRLRITKLYCPGTTRRYRIVKRAVHLDGW